MAQNPVFRDVGALQNLGQSMDNVVLGLARQRYLERLQSQQFALAAKKQQLDEILGYKRGALLDAQTLFQNQRAKEIEREGTAFTSMGQAAGDFLDSDSWQGPLGPGMSNPMAADAKRRFVTAMLSLPANKTTYAPEKLAQASYLGDALMQRILAARGNVNNLVTKLGPNQTAVSSVPELETTRGMVKLKPGETMFDAKVGEFTDGLSPIASVPTAPGKRGDEQKMQFTQAMQFLRLHKDPFTGELKRPDPSVDVNRARDFDLAQKIVSRALNTVSPASLDIPEDMVNDVDSEEAFSVTPIAEIMARQPPEMETSRKEAERLIKQYPDVANKIKQRFEQVYKQKF